MSYQPTQVHYGHSHPMEIEENSLYTCPYCQSEILEYNKDTHEARCARMHRNQPQRPVEQPQMVIQQPQRQQQQPQRAQLQDLQQPGRQGQQRPNNNGLHITREHSSSSLPYPEIPDNMRQPQINREARRVADNKLVTCSNCEKSVREQDLSQHQARDCEANDKIPCEFCNKQIPMNFYSQHLDDCPQRHQEMGQQQQQNQRPRSLERQDSWDRRREQREMQERQRQEQRRVQSAERVPNPRMQQQQQSQYRPQEPQEEPQQQSGGFMNLLKNLATVVLKTRGDIEDSQSEQPRTQTQSQPQPQVHNQHAVQQNQGQQPGFISRLLGLRQETPEERQERQRQMEERRRQYIEQREREQAERRRVQEAMEQQRREQHRQMFENFFETRNRGQQQQQQMQSGNPNVRTIRLGPNGSIIMSYGNQPQRQRMGQMEQNPFQGFHPMQMRGDNDDLARMGPLGILLSMMNGGAPGMENISPEELENMTEEQQAGLAKEVLDSLSVIKYDKEKNKNVPEDAKSCPVCIEDFSDGDEVRYLWCMHRFHKDCIDKWLEKHTNCPICKKEFSENDVSYDA